eukprot:scaffold2568_cov246-Pinguiococcus_pyrenoidosus.AAC.3
MARDVAGDAVQDDLQSRRHLPVRPTLRDVVHALLVMEHKGPAALRVREQAPPDPIALARVERHDVKPHRVVVRAQSRRPHRLQRGVAVGFHHLLERRRIAKVLLRDAPHQAG